MDASSTTIGTQEPRETIGDFVARRMRELKSQQFDLRPARVPDGFAPPLGFEETTAAELAAAEARARLRHEVGDLVLGVWSGKLGPGAMHARLAAIRDAIDRL